MTVISCLYYGIKYGIDYIVAASPQYFVGDYLLKQTRTNEVVKFMSGNDEEDDHQFLNSIMGDMIKGTSHKPNIFIHLGKGEMHYQKHVKPMIADLKNAGLPYTLDLGDYDKHNDVGKFFPTILKSSIRDYLDFPSLSIKLEGIENKFRYTAITEENNKVAWYLYKNNKKIEVRGYATDKFLDIEFEGRGSYKMKVFVQNEKGHRVSKVSHEIKI